jgi:serine/threonine protein kinase/Tfp pilus assembly protein PilF
MDPARWRQIEQMFHLAFEQEPSKRASFLMQSCGTDIELRSEVESLLAEADEADRSQPVAAVRAGSAAGLGTSVAGASFSSTRRLGRYELLEQVGKGGMGVVYRAIDPAIGRTVAIKTIPLNGPDEGQDPELRMRLFRESQAGGRLSHPNIVAVYDVNEQGSTAYIVMEYVVGRTLEHTIASSPAGLSLGEVVRIVQDCANALDYAHSQGVVHRDIKPANIMLQADGGVKIADFGIAKAAQLTSLTQSSVILGSPHYMAPEQWRGEAVTGRTDQYALAVVAYSLLTGLRPFQCDSMATLAAKVLYEEPPPATSLSPSLPAALDEVFRRALAKAPAARYETCTQFASALRAAVERVPAPAAAPARLRATQRPANWIPVVLGVAFILAAVAGVWLYQRNSVAQLEIAYWSSIKDSKTSAPYEEYLKRYPDGQFAGAAHAQIEALKNLQPPVSTSIESTSETSSRPKIPPAKTPDKSTPTPVHSETPPPQKLPPVPAVDPYLQAETLMKSGDYARAVPFFTQAIAATPDYRSYFGRAGANQRLEHIPQAIDDYTQAIRLNPSSGMAFHERAICLARQNQDDRALADFNRALELSPGYALSWNGRGAIYLHHKDYPRALSDFNEAIRLQPNFYQAYKNRAAARKALGDIAGANADLNQAGKLKP